MAAAAEQVLLLAALAAAPPGPRGQPLAAAGARVVGLVVLLVVGLAAVQAGYLTSGLAAWLVLRTAAKSLLVQVPWPLVSLL